MLNIQIYFVRLPSESCSKCVSLEFLKKKFKILLGYEGNNTTIFPRDRYNMFKPVRNVVVFGSKSRNDIAEGRE